MKILKFVGLFFLVLFILSTSSFLIINYSLPEIEKDISILVLGKGGEGHTAPNLTDTMMVVNFNNKSRRINVFSLPRDIWITEIRAKLNTAYHYGGFEMARNSVYSVTGLPIDNIVVVDFSLFKDFIDSIGGIQVDIENSFTDKKYPIAGLENDLCNGDKTYSCRYETIDFNEGDQKMGGDLALKFVRSRNAEGSEGTDLAREKRQQKVIDAVRQKLFSSEVIINPKTIKNLYSVFTRYVETDLDVNTIKILAKFAIESKLDINFLSVPEDLLTVSMNNIKYDKQYVFLPTSGNWSQLQEWIKNNI